MSILKKYVLKIKVYMVLKKHLERFKKRPRTFLKTFGMFF